MTPAEKASRRKKMAIAAVVGAVLAALCRALPPEYHVVCDTILKICTVGSL